MEFRFLTSDALWLQAEVAEPPLGLSWDPPVEAADLPPHCVTTLYVWGYGEPQSLLSRERCSESAAARQFAAEAGGDATRSGAWARELTLPLRLTQVLREVEPDLRRDDAVAGWGAHEAAIAGCGLDGSCPCVVPVLFSRAGRAGLAIGGFGNSGARRKAMSQPREAAPRDAPAAGQATPDPALERIQRDRQPGEIETGMMTGSDDSPISATDRFEGELSREEALRIMAAIPGDEEADEPADQE